MSNGYRQERTRHLGYFGVSGAIVICSLIVGLFGYLQGQHSERSKSANQAYSQSAKKNAERNCIGKSAAAMFECVDEFVENSREQSDSYQGLIAQYRAADSAMFGTIFSLLTLVISALGVWYVKRTLDATLEAVEDTSDATKAMQEANRIAGNSQRPWVSIDNIECSVCRPSDLDDGQNGISFHISYDLVNYGRTPARSVCDLVIFSENGKIHDAYPNIYGNAFEQAPVLGKIIFPDQRENIDSPHAVRGIAFPKNIQSVALSVVIYVTYRGESGQTFITGRHVSIWSMGSSENLMISFNIDDLPDNMSKACVIYENDGNIVF